MKILSSLMIFCFASVAINAQQFNGKLKNFPSTQFTIRYSLNGIKTNTDTVFVNDAGNFRHSWRMKYPARITIFFTDFISQEAFMGPGLSLTIEADLSTETLYTSSRKFSGSAAKYNDYLIELEKSKRYQTFDIWQHYDSIVALPTDELIQFTNTFLFIRDSICKAWFKPLKQDELAQYFARTDSINAMYYSLQWRMRHGFNMADSFKLTKSFFQMRYQLPRT